MPVPASGGGFEMQTGGGIHANTQWLARLNIFKPDVPFLGPVLDGATDVLWPVVTTNNLRFATPGDDLLQGP